VVLYDSVTITTESSTSVRVHNH